MGCVSSITGACACLINAEADDGCNPVSVVVTGAGSVAVPYVIGTSFDFTRLVRLDGNEPWAVGTDGGCTVLVPRCRYSVA